MGEAKRREMIETLAGARCKPISRARFNLLTMGTRQLPQADLSEELSWWSIDGDTLLGMVGRDVIDDKYLWMVMARDRIGRFRCADLRVDYRSKSVAERQLRAEMAKIVDDGEVAEFGIQGDETNSPLDPFAVPPSTDPETLHPYFRQLATNRANAPARKVITELVLWLAPAEPQFVREFQGAGFDQRLWEMYLWAALREFRLDVTQLEAPDFLCRGLGGAFTIEATTVAPSERGPLSEHPEPQTPEELEVFLHDYMAIKFGSALTSKLRKRNKAGQPYWDRDESRDLPFLIALADFHDPATKDAPGSMVYTQSALWEYLYGLRISHHHNDQGGLIIDYEPVSEHTFGEKKIPSNFFASEEAENVAAVMFSNAGTLAKFDRMGVAAGFGAHGCTYIRRGFLPDPDPDAAEGRPFAVEVGADDYEEWWSQEVQVFHNPHARNPLPEEALLGATHHWLIDGKVMSSRPMDAVLSSTTMILQTVDTLEDEGSNKVSGEDQTPSPPSS